MVVAAADARASAFLPRRALARVVLSLVQNGLDASPAGSTVALRISAHERLEVVVEDHGQGMTPDLVSRAGEPFFTTKPPGQGLGLGLFLARSLADQLDGRFTIDSAPGRGTTVALRLPLQVQSDVAPA